jgi:hypothetical protein
MINILGHWKIDIIIQLSNYTCIESGEWWKIIKKFEGKS